MPSGPLEINSGIQQEKKDNLNKSNIGEYDDGTQQKFYCLITGANSGLGLTLCCRFLTHFLVTRPATHHLTLIFTTRSPSKSLQTTTHILSSLRTSFPPTRIPTERFTLAPEFVDLSDLLSVYALSARLRKSYEKIDWVFCNAGLLTTVANGGVDYVRGVAAFLTRPVQAATWPDFKLQNKGEIALQGEKPKGGKVVLVKGAKNDGGDEGVDEDEGLGLIFCANVFGHYCLIRGILSLLSRGGVRKGERARVVLTSSLDAFARSFDINDIQCIRGEELYESSKRLIDILVSTWPESGFSDTRITDKSRLPKFFLTHPAICATNIAGQHPVIWYLMLAIFYIVRIFFGSPWHPITGWKGNAANMWVAMEREEVLDKKGREKWGSGCKRFGEEIVLETEMEGIEGGVVSEEVRLVGRECWRRMEELRRHWERKLGVSCDS